MGYMCEDGNTSLKILGVLDVTLRNHLFTRSLHFSFAAMNADVAFDLAVSYKRMS